MPRISTIEGYYEPAGYVQITDLSSASVLSSVPDEAKLAVIQVEGASIRWRDDGEDPTANVGMQQSVGDIINYTGTISAFKAIQSGSGAKLNVSYYK